MDRHDGATVAICLLSLAVLAVVAASLPVDQTDSGSAPGEGGEASGPTEEPPVTTRIGFELLSLAPTLFLVALGVAGAILALLAHRTLTRPPADDGTGDRGSPEDEGTADDDSLEAVAATAGRAAERIRQAESVENEIYRAWRELTRAVSTANPEATTPGEFSAAAIRAGMAEDDVRELTRLFNDVRYGDREPTPAAERRAVEVLERIERSYRRDRS